MLLRRFVEFEYRKREMLHNSAHLTEQQVIDILDNMSTHWDDLTFGFIERSTGWKTKITCNSSDEELTVDDLSPVAMKWYVAQLKQLTLKRIKEKSLIAV